MLRSRPSGVIAFTTVLLVLGLTYSLTHLYTLTKENEDLVSQNQEIRSRLSRFESEIQREQSSQGPARMESVRGHAPQSPSPVSITAPASEQAGQAGQGVANDHEAGHEAEDAQAANDAEDRKQQVDELHSRLQEVRAQRANLLAQSSADQFNQNSSQKLEFDQLTAQISQGSDSLDQLRQQLALAQATYGNNQFDMAAAAQVQDLKVSIENQQAALQRLRDQRDADNFQWTYNIGAARFQAEQQLKDLSAEEQEIRDQLQRLSADPSHPSAPEGP